ncbi:MAG TPA: protein kinase [Kofleriaceae bacterium]
MGAEPDAEESFGPYLVYERLGVGGMATVHRARERGIEGFERIVALKRLLPHLAEDATFIKAFVREAKLASALNHVNIVQIYELGRVGTEYFISMEHIDGRDIRRVLRHARKVTGPPPPNVTVGLLLQLCDALDYAHTKIDEHGVPMGLVHRDVSPSNVLVTKSGSVKVIDFGIAKAQSSQLRTQTGRVKGKLAYMAPEAIAGGRDLDARSDLFAVGVIAHELLTARPLFASKNEYQTLLKVQRGDIMPPSTFNQNVPAELDAIVLRALARDPDDRFSSAAELRDELLALRHKHRLQTGVRDVSMWLDWAFSLDMPNDVLGPGAASDAPIADIAWDGGEGSGSPIVLDDVPDVSQRIAMPSAKLLRESQPRLFDEDPSIDVEHGDDEEDDDVPTPLPQPLRRASTPNIARTTSDTRAATPPALSARTSTASRALSHSSQPRAPERRSSELLDALHAANDAAATLENMPAAVAFGVDTQPAGTSLEADRGSTGQIERGSTNEIERTSGSDLDDQTSVVVQRAPNAPTFDPSIEADDVDPTTGKSKRRAPTSGATEDERDAVIDPPRPGTKLGVGRDTPMPSRSTPMPRTTPNPSKTAVGVARNTPNPSPKTAPMIPVTPPQRPTPDLSRATPDPSLPMLARGPSTSTHDLALSTSDGAIPTPDPEQEHEVSFTPDPEESVPTHDPAVSAELASRRTGDIPRGPRARTHSGSSPSNTTGPQQTIGDHAPVRVAATKPMGMRRGPHSPSLSAPMSEGDAATSAAAPKSIPPKDAAERKLVDDSVPSLKPRTKLGHKPARAETSTPPDDETPPTASSVERKARQPNLAASSIGMSIIERDAKPNRTWLVLALIALVVGAAAGTLYLTRTPKPAPVKAIDDKPRGTTGVVAVELEPLDAEVSIDGTLVHTGSPWQTDLSAGSHSIEIHKQGYKAWLTTVNVTAGERQMFTVALAPLGGMSAGSASLTKQPGKAPAPSPAAAPTAPAPKSVVPAPDKHGEITHPTTNEVADTEPPTTPATASTAIPMATAQYAGTMPPPASTGSAPPVPAPPAPVIEAKPAAPSIATNAPPPTVAAPTTSSITKPAAPTTPMVVTSGSPATVAPNAVKRLSGEIPELVSKNDVATVVAAKMCIDWQGSVTSVELITKLEPRMALEMKKTLATWKYAPYQAAGARVPTAACFAVSFRTK